MSEESQVHSMIALRGLKLAWPWALFCLQAFCVAMLMTEALADFFGAEASSGTSDDDTFEYLIVGALMFSLVASGFEIRKVLNRQKRMENQIKIASGEFTKLLEDHFKNWALTPSEREVALLSIKGFSIAEIAALRATKDGTVKAQCNAIYRKADVSGRPQLLSLFIDELLDGSLLPLGSRQAAH